MSALGISVDLEISEIRDGFNAFVLGVLAMGMYTVIYFGTMHIYFTKSSSKRLIVPATITMLFISNVVLTGVQWFITKWQFVDNGATRDSLFLSFFEGPNWFYTATDTASYTGFMLADGLLIWRCFFVWNRSFRILSVPLLLFVTEIALFFVLLVLRSLHGGVFASAVLQARIDNLSSAAYLTAFVGSLLTTVLIAYRIHSSTARGVSARRFKHVINIIVESGAVYSLCLLAAAGSNVIPAARDPLNTSGIAFDNYVAALTSVISGMAATILVARVSTLPTNATFPSTSIHLSGLQFHANSTRQTDTVEVMGADHSGDVECIPVGEGLRDEEKI